MKHNNDLQISLIPSVCLTQHLAARERKEPRSVSNSLAEEMMNMIRIIITCLMLGFFGCMAEVPHNKQFLKNYEASFVDSFLGSQFVGIFLDGIIAPDTPLVIREKLSIHEIMTGWNNMADFTANLIQEAKQQKNKKSVEAVRDFCSKNSSESTINEIGTLSIKHVVLTEEQAKTLFSDWSKGWEIFYQTYPKSPGIIELSRPGFSKDGTVAIIYMGQSANMIAGAGQLSVFQKKDGEWVDSGIRIGPAWIS
jgi:hypothetical protein